MTGKRGSNEGWEWAGVNTLHDVLDGNEGGVDEGHHNGGGEDAGGGEDGQGQLSTRTLAQPTASRGAEEQALDFLPKLDSKQIRKYNTGTGAIVRLSVKTGPKTDPKVQYRNRSNHYRLSAKAGPKTDPKVQYRYLILRKG